MTALGDRDCQQRPIAVGRRLHRLMANRGVINSGYVLAAAVVTAALGYGYWFVAAKFYSASDVGLAAALISALTIASALSNLGVHSVLVQVLPKHRNDQALWSSWVSSLMLLGAVTGLVGATASLFILRAMSAQFAVVTRSIFGAILLTLGVILWTVGTAFDWAFVAERASKYMFYRNTVFAILKLILVAVPPFTILGARGVLLSWVSASLVSVVTAVHSLKRIAPSLTFVIRGTLARLYDVRLMLAGNHFTNIGNAATVFMLPILVVARLSARQNAYFYVAWNIGSVLFMVPMAISTTLFSEGAHSPNTVRSQSARSALLALTFMLPMGAILWIFAHAILRVVGEEYALEGRRVLTILVIASVPTAITQMYTAVLRVEHRYRFAAALNLELALVTLAGTWWLLPKIGIATPGWLWLVAQSIGASVVGLDILTSRYKWNRKSKAP